jgi:hypothetical protein
MAWIGERVMVFGLPAWCTDQLVGARGWLGVGEAASPDVWMPGVRLRLNQDRRHLATPANFCALEHLFTFSVDVSFRHDKVQRPHVPPGQRHGVGQDRAESWQNAITCNPDCCL